MSESEATGSGLETERMLSPGDLAIGSGTRWRLSRVLTPIAPSNYNPIVPTILRECGFRFSYYLADRFEPPHIWGLQP